MGKLIGILGGMGPESSLLLYKYLTIMKKVEVEQEHLKILIYSNPKVPDRTQAILSKDYGPVVKELENSLNLLKRSGAKDIVISCNTAHFFLPFIKVKEIRIISLIESVKDELVSQNISKVLLLATRGTIISGIYQKELENNKIKAKLPDASDQKRLMKIIYEVKIKGVSNKLKNELLGLIKKYRISNVILGCTELSLLMEEQKNGNLLDPLKLATKKIIGG